MSLNLPQHADPAEALGALPDSLRQIVEPLGRPGELIACDLYNLLHIVGKGDYFAGAADGSLLTMALTSIGAATVRSEITQAQHDKLHAYALQAYEDQLAKKRA